MTWGEGLKRPWVLKVEIWEVVMDLIKSITEFYDPRCERFRWLVIMSDDNFESFLVHQYQFLVNQADFK